MDKNHSQIIKRREVAKRNSFFLTLIRHTCDLSEEKRTNVTDIHSDLLSL